MNWRNSRRVRTVEEMGRNMCTYQADPETHVHIGGILGNEPSSDTEDDDGGGPVQRMGSRESGAQLLVVVRGDRRVCVGDGDGGSAVAVRGVGGLTDSHDL
jgi:hypothetical protein